MQTSLEHLPAQKQRELARILEIIRSKVEVELVILFGSFARGDWVSDNYVEDSVTYEYQSDFDILVVAKSKKLEENSGIWNALEDIFLKTPGIKTPVNLIVDNIHFVNDRILEGNYFYTDIKKEGILLYTSGNFNLSEPKVLSQVEQQKLAARDYDFWYKKAQSFLKDFQHNMEDEEWNNAAFHLHQVTEALLVAVALVFTGYRPKTHDIGKIEALVVDHLPNIRDIFPRKTEEQRHNFELLRKAYVDSRYKADYVISKEELLYLMECVENLMTLVVTVCAKKITI